MGEIFAAGARLARGVTGFAVSGLVAVGPRVGRGTRPMPIDPTVQEGEVVRAGSRPVDAPARFEGRLKQTPRTA